MRYVEATYIRNRRKLIKKMLDNGLKVGSIYKKLKNIKEGRYKAARSTILKDIKEIVKKRENWEKIHNPHQMDIWQRKRQESIDALEILIKKATKKKQYKTAGELIQKKARLEGVDKFIAPKEKKKDDIAEKYQNKTQEQINETLFQEFKDLSATLIRMAKDKKLNNIEKITIRILRKNSDGKKVKYIITRFGEEKKIYIEQKGLNK